ncbi:MAG: glucokinase [Methylococcales symbiont of Hymedesmia sp. n. MRB-2018]|nr:MAG: glucokinase [Methylococcales symbiont of Hymedesmia sp. n. MRB-2018]
MILAGDLGGTKTILAIYEQDKNVLHCIKKETYISADFNNFEKLLDRFLAVIDNVQIDSVCLGVAGPVVNGDCNTTNLPWVLKTKELITQTHTQKVALLNDLEATAWGILYLPESDFVELNPNAKESLGNKAVIAAGTGLGEALLVWSNNKYHVVATEGGHTDFAPRNALEIGLLRYLMELYPEHVSYQEVVCGKGLVNIYNYLKSIDYALVNQSVESQMQKGDSAAIIAQQAHSENAPLCTKALALFCEIYGAEAGNLALKCLSEGGVVLAGGIAAKNLSSIQQGGFLKGFLAKGVFQSLLQDFSVKVCLNQEVGLLGSAHFSKRFKP